MFIIKNNGNQFENNKIQKNEVLSGLELLLFFCWGEWWSCDWSGRWRKQRRSFRSWIVLMVMSIQTFVVTALLDLVHNHDNEGNGQKNAKSQKNPSDSLPGGFSGNSEGNILVKQIDSRLTRRELLLLAQCPLGFHRPLVQQTLRTLLRSVLLSLQPRPIPFEACRRLHCRSCS